MTLFEIAAEAAPTERLTTVMAMMTTGVVVGQSAAAAATGVIVDICPYRMGFLMCLGAMCALGMVGIIHKVRVTGRGPITRLRL